MGSNRARRAWAAVLMVGALAPGCAKDAITHTPAKLELVPIDDSVDPLSETVVLPRGATVATERVPVAPDELATVHFVRLGAEGDEPTEASLERLRTWLDEVDVDQDRRWLVGAMVEGRGSNQAGWRSYLARNEAVITAADVADATVGEDTVTGTPHVDVQLTADAAERFRAFTRTHTRRRLAIVVDGRVESAPVVQQEIEGGRIQVTVSGDPKDQRAEARRLAAALRAAARN